jgi:hypothetical protein
MGGTRRHLRRDVAVGCGCVLARPPAAAVSTATVTEPVLDLIGSDEDDVEHLYCCDPDVAVCGLDLSDYDENDDPIDDCKICELCERAKHLPCANPKCPDRARWWQVWK